MSAEPQAVLTATDGSTVPLQGVTAHGTLSGLLYELTVEQRYHNPTERNLEAVFTFPLPLRAVLLGFDLEIGERKLSAVAVARQEASERYEEAIDQGDSAALIEHNGNGLYTVSLGNLLAGESAVIRYRYAELLDAHEGHVRLNVPTVIAPRYGDPADSGLEGPAIPGVDVFGEYPFAITLDLIGLTDAEAIRSPSHKITTTAGEGGLTVSLTRTGFLDRDFVLELDAAAVPKDSLVAPDGDGFVMLTSTTLALDAAEQRPVALKLLLDCSGSMGGDSIAAAKRALLAILECLTPQDQVSLTRFGSSVHHVSEGLEPADAHSLTPLKALVRQIDADLGGTEMRGALKATLAIKTPKDRTADLILITDGEVYDLERIIDLAAQSSHRLFAIAIGAAPNEALARALSEKTGGACEFVGPTEDAEAAILRTFKRLRSTPRTLAAVDWPATPAWVALLPTAVFPGDTLHLMAGFTSQPASDTTLSVRDSAGRGTTMCVITGRSLAAGDLIPRLTAARRLASLPDAEARDLAVRYQLATEHTSFVVVAERDDGEKATGLPATVAVPHMLAAGWGGTSEVCASPSLRSDRIAMDFSYDAAPASVRRRSSLEIQPDRSIGVDSELLDNDSEGAEISSRGVLQEAERIRLVLSLVSHLSAGGPLPTTLEKLEEALAVPPLLSDYLRMLVVDGNDERDVIAVLLATITWHDPTASGIDLVRELQGAVFSQRGYRELRAAMQDLLP